jgi:hypothetical protein
VRFLAPWRASYTGGGPGTLPTGTVARLVVNPQVLSPSPFYARSIDGEAIEMLVVPPDSAPTRSLTDCHCCSRSEISGRGFVLSGTNLVRPYWTAPGTCLH